MPRGRAHPLPRPPPGQVLPAHTRRRRRHQVHGRPTGAGAAQERAAGQGGQQRGAQGGSRRGRRAVAPPCLLCCPPAPPRPRAHPQQENRAAPAKKTAAEVDAELEKERQMAAMVCSLENKEGERAAKEGGRGAQGLCRSGPQLVPDVPDTPAPCHPLASLHHVLGLSSAPNGKGTQSTGAHVPASPPACLPSWTRSSSRQQQHSA